MKITELQKLPRRRGVSAAMPCKWARFRDRATSAALGYADVLATAFSHAMRYRPEEPEWEGRDRFLLSHGHYAIAYYAALLEAEIIPQEELETYGSDDSRLPMSGMATYTPGMEMSGGSLGQGLSIAVGMALGLRQKRSASWVYNSMSDGELDEGSTWEAAMSAAHYGLTNLINIVDVNKQQADGDSRKILGFEPLHENGPPSAGTCSAWTATIWRR